MALSSTSQKESGLAINAALGLIGQAVNLGFVLIAYIWFVWSGQNDIASFWLVLSLLISLIQQADFGFQISLSRSLSFVMGGAQRLETIGVHNQAQVNNGEFEVNQDLAGNVLRASRFVYARLSFATVCLGCPLGYFYLLNVLTNLSETDLIITWTIVIIAMFFNFRFSHFNVALFGYSRVREWYLSIIINRLTFLVFLIIISNFDIGLSGVAICFLVGVLCGKFYAFWASKDIFKRFNVTKASYDDLKDVLSAILPNTLRLGLISISAYISLKIGALILSSAVGAEAAEPINFWSSLFIAALALSSSFANIRVPKLAQLWVTDEKLSIRQEVVWIYSRATATFLGSVGVIFLLIYSLLEITHIEVPILEEKWLILLFLIYFFELGHSLACIIISSGNILPFMAGSVLSGIFIAILSFFLIPFFGGPAVIISQGLVQLSYNNWRWPLYLSRSLSSISGGKNAKK